MRILRLLARESRGATAIEFALVAALIAVAALVAMRGLGSSIDNTFSNIQGAVAANG
jgi:pilus assembly protein Flp/PilA